MTRRNNKDFTLVDVHTFPNFKISGDCAWVMMKNGKMEIVLSETQLRGLAEDINAALEDMPVTDMERCQDVVFDRMGT